MTATTAKPHISLAIKDLAPKWTFELPSSKSLSNRALIINHLYKQKIKLSNLSTAQDTLALIAALENNDLEQQNIGGAGTAMRFLTAYYAVQPEKSVVLSGDERMHQRPIKDLVDALLQLGADIQYLGQEGFPPLKITGKKLIGGQVTVNSQVSSQFITALMLIAPKTKEGIEIQFNEVPISQTYITMTMSLMSSLGFLVDHTQNNITVAPGRPRAKKHEVENDWSSASYAYALMALVPDVENIELPKLKKKSWQGDGILPALFHQWGIETHFEPKATFLSHPTATQPKAFECFMQDHPDLVMTFAVVCCLQQIPFRLSGIKHLAYKESNRIQALINELQKIGAEDINFSEDALVCNHFNNDFKQKPAIHIQTYDDHRMAMSFAPAALLYPQIKIEQPDCVQKSFPKFWEQIARNGIELTRLTL